MGCFTSKPINANKQTSMRLSQKVRYYHDLDVAALKKFFDLYDADGDGYISQDDFQRVLLKTGMSLTPERLDWLVMAADKNGDGKIDFAEFLNIESYPYCYLSDGCFLNLTLKETTFLPERRLRNI
ncbi:hypothetical protein L596_020663 [Steinernema carpocapsae]|uniref:EF-hand domain-containing protein n=1 Tax=Steinernema carpocapsae TaxID=34508 RepID=A0A4U5MUE8_STECR|nr:hypothetical protein L596_020663 [Steinernema carpocapsae]